LLETKHPVLAVDGFTKVGKSTICRLVARMLGFHQLASGYLYRAVGLVAQRRKIDIADVAQLAEVARHLDIQFEGESVILEGKDETNFLDSEAASNLAKVVAAIVEVREGLRCFQLSMRKAPGLVADGRDMCYIFDTPYRFFLIALPEIRAARRVRHLLAKGKPADYDQILADIKSRDHDDKTRKVSPLVIHPGALVIDTEKSDPKTLAELIVRHFRRQCNSET
jgi:cytidylate kinase